MRSFIETKVVPLVDCVFPLLWVIIRLRMVQFSFHIN